MNKDINYYRSIANSHNCTQQESDIYEVQNSIMYDFESNPSCKNVLLNGEPTKVIVYVKTDIVTGGQSYKIMRRPNEPLNIGDILVIDNETWFVTKVDTERLIIKMGTLAKSVSTLKFYKNGILRELPCFINVGTRNYINERDNDHIRVPASLYTVYCPDLGYLDKTDAGMRFVVKNYVYRAVGIDNLTVLDGEIRDGLIIMKFIDDSISEDDNMELGIANYYSNQKIGFDDETSVDNGYTITNTMDTNRIYLGDTIPVTYQITNRKGQIVDLDCNIYVTDEENKPIDYVKLIKKDGKLYLKSITNVKYIGYDFKLVISAKYKASESIRLFTVKNNI